MHPEKSLIQEQAIDAAAIKDSRATPIQQNQDRSMNFIRNFVLGIPTQELIETNEPLEEPVPETGELDSVKRLAGLK